MRVIPLAYCPTLSEDDIYRHECSDRIWVPRHTFERWLTAEDAGTVVIVQLEGVPACMYAPHAGPRNVIYAPMWMCEELGVSLDPPMEEDGEVGDDDDRPGENSPGRMNPQRVQSTFEDDFIVPERLHPPMCTFMKVQPHTSDHLPACVGGRGGEEMPEDTLSRAFEEYTCVRSGQTMTLHLPSGDRMFVTITETEPAVGPLCIRSTEIAMDLLEPLDRPALPEPVPAPVLAPAPKLPQVPEPAPEPVLPQETREERRERMARAAMARMAAATAATAVTAASSTS